MRLKFNVNSKKFYMIGDPMDHSCVTPVLNAAYEYLNLDAVCTLAEIPKGSLPQFIEAAKLLGVSGFHVTMPHKQDIAALVDECDEQSRLFQSVNAVRIENGKLIGTGMDGAGMVSAISDVTNDFEGKTALMLGAGAVSGLIASELCKRGVKSVVIANRTVEKAQNIADILKKLYPDVQTEVGPLDDAFLSQKAPAADLVVQCTSLGMHGSGNYSSLQFVEHLPTHAVAADVLYPTTPFLEAAKARGMKTVNGMWMALHQMKEICRFMFDLSMPDEGLLALEEAFWTAVTLRDIRFRREAESNR